MATVVVLIAFGSSWTVPSDYGTPSTVDCFGCGAQGIPGIISPPSPGPGGGGAAWARKNNLALTPGASIPLFIGGVSGSGRQTWFQSTSTVLADGGNGQTGGLAGNCVGDAVASGGNGANGAAGTGGGGGGAAGPSGAGGAASSTTGGTGGNGAGGAGGTASNNGGNGAEYTITGGGHAGSGGGGGGCLNFGGGDFAVGNGGSYGGGGGGASSGQAFPTGAPGTGAIIITYTSSSGPPPGGSHRRVGVSVSG